MRKWSLSALRKELWTLACLCGLVVIVGVDKKRVISKGMAGCPVLSFATLVKIQKKGHLEHDNFISHTALLQYPQTLAYNIAPHILSSSTPGSVLDLLQFTLNNNIPDRLVFLNTVTLLCLNQFFQTHS